MNHVFDSIGNLLISYSIEEESSALQNIADYSDLRFEQE